MKDIMMQIVVNIPSILCIGISGYLIANGIAGWGWFLVVGVLAIYYVRGENEKNSN